MHEWLTSVHAGVWDGVRVVANTEPVTSTEIVEAISEHLTKSGNGVERKLLSKSVQETLFYCIGFDTKMSQSQFKAQMVRYLGRHSASNVIQLFLSLYFFNFVWFETGDSFRSVAWTLDSFEQHMEAVEAICKRVVNLAWKKFEESGRPLDLPAARALTVKIEQLLRGIPSGDFR